MGVPRGIPAQDWSGGVPRPRSEYDAARRSPHRRERKLDVRTEAAIASAEVRAKLTSGGRSLKRNSVQARWLIRTHCTLITELNFHARTGDRELDRKIERLVARRSQRDRCDAAGRHMLSRLIWLAELGAVVDGDALLHMDPEGKLSLIEGPRVGEPKRDAPAGVTKDTHPEGVKVDETGRVVEYLIGEAQKHGGVNYQATLPAEDCHLHGYWDALGLVRGVSPLASALEAFADIREAEVLALARIKLEQLLAVKITRKRNDAIDELPAARALLAEGEEEPEPAPAEEVEEDEEDEGGYTLDFEDGLGKLDMDPDDDAAFMQGVAPHSNVREFLQVVLQAALHALDLDYSFYDSSHSNYSASRNAMALHRRSGRVRRQACQETLLWIARRWLQLDVAAGKLELPSEFPTVDDLPIEWVGGGIGWGDIAKEAKGHAAAIALGLESRQHAVREINGRDWFDVADELELEGDELRRRGLNDVAAAIATTPTVELRDDPEDEAPARSGRAAA